MQRDETHKALALLIVALVMLIAAGSAITAVAVSSLVDQVDDASGEAQAFPAALTTRSGGSSDGVFTAQVLPLRQNEIDMSRAQRRSAGAPREFQAASQATAAARPFGQPA